MAIVGAALSIAGVCIAVGLIIVIIVVNIQWNIESKQFLEKIRRDRERALRSMHND